MQNRYSNSQQAADRQAQLYEKHRNVPFADRAAKIGFVTGAAAPSIITGSVVSPGFATALNAVNSYGAAQGQAISEGATLQQSGLYAAATAGKEYVINQLFGGIPHLSGKTYSPNAINILGEGAENVLSDVTQPYLKRIFYDKDAPAPTFKDLLSSFADGVDVSLFLNTAPDFVKIKPDDRMGIIHKAYAEELDRQIKQEMKEKHPELFEMQKENKVDTDSILGYNTDNNWAKDNGIITVREYENFRTKAMSINAGIKFEKTKTGLYIIPTGDEYGVNNTLIFTDGDTVNPSIEKVVHINLDNETQIAEVRDYIYGKEVVQWRASRKDVKKIYGQEVFNVYNRQNSRHIRGKITGGKRTSRTNDKQYNRQQPDGRGDTGKSNETVENYLGENIYAYADEDRGGYSITLANGKKRKIVFRRAKGEWKYMVDGKVYSSIEERIREENRLLYSKNRLEE